MSTLELDRVKVAGMDFYVRPGTSDMLVLREVFVANEYRIPSKMTGVVIDVGSNIGALSIRAAAAGATVFAYEAEAENARVANQNILLHGVQERVNVDNVAVWRDFDGVYLTPAQGNTGTNDAEGDVFVPSITLASILAGHSEVELLKMDVEGAEIPIFGALDPVSLQGVKRIAMEYHGQTPEFGAMIRKLSGVFDLEIVGHPHPGENSGGMIYGTRKP